MKRQAFTVKLNPDQTFLLNISEWVDFKFIELLDDQYMWIDVEYDEDEPFELRTYTIAGKPLPADYGFKQCVGVVRVAGMHQDPDILLDCFIYEQ